MIEHDDKKLVHDCLNGSKQAFEQVVDKYQKMIFNMVYRMIHNLDDAEDITQGIFIKVFENLNSFNPKYKFFSWMYRIAINESLNHINRMKPFDPLSENLVALEKTPDKTYNGVEISEKIQQALMQIDPDYRMLIILKHFQDCSYKEIAVISNIPEKTIKSRLFTARQLLKEILVREGMIPDD
jgi:RNA polymerase sigma-70 factor (ECF subfamily)